MGFFFCHVRKGHSLEFEVFVQKVVANLSFRIYEGHFLLFTNCKEQIKY